MCCFAFLSLPSFHYHWKTLCSFGTANRNCTHTLIENITLDSRTLTRQINSSKLLNYRRGTARPICIRKQRTVTSRIYCVYMCARIRVEEDDRVNSLRLLSLSNLSKSHTHPLSMSNFQEKSKHARVATDCYLHNLLFVGGQG